MSIFKIFQKKRFYGFWNVCPTSMLLQFWSCLALTSFMCQTHWCSNLLPLKLFLAILILQTLHFLHHWICLKPSDETCCGDRNEFQRCLFFNIVSCCVRLVLGFGGGGGWRMPWYKRLSCCTPCHSSKGKSRGIILLNMCPHTSSKCVA